METRWNVGIVGCGTIADIYLKNLQSLFSGRLQVWGLFNRTAEKAQILAAKYGISRCYTRYEDMLQDPDIHIILNLTSPQAHARITRQALEYGKHVYSEKPLAETAAQGEALVALAAEKGLCLACAPDVPLGAMIQTARHLVDSGVIGRVIGATANLCKAGVETWHPNPRFLFEAGAGPLMDMGPYYLTALLHLIGPFSAVTAMAAKNFPVRTISSQPHYGEQIEVAVPTYVTALLQTESGALVSLLTTFDVAATQLPKLELYGEKGSLCLTDPNCFGGSILLSLGGSAYQSVPLDFPYAENCRGLGLWEMARYLCPGRKTPVDGEYALHILQTMEGIQASAQTGQRVILSSNCGRPLPLVSP